MATLMAVVQELIADFWRDDDFFDRDATIPSYSYDLPWKKYEDFMQAQLVEIKPGWEGLLIIRFPASCSEDSNLHIHPISDRIVTVLEGSGEFVAIRNEEFVRYALQPACRVWMPRGVVHNFVAGPQGLLVESRHLPFVPFSDPQCLVRWSSR